jgi:type II secretory pathway pseudopilin PulG
MNIRVIGERWFPGIRYGFSLFFIVAVLMAAILPHFLSWRDRRAIHAEVASNRVKIQHLEKDARQCPCHRNAETTTTRRLWLPSTAIAPVSSHSSLSATQ